MTTTYKQGDKVRTKEHGLVGTVAYDERPFPFNVCMWVVFEGCRTPTVVETDHLVKI